MFNRDENRYHGFDFPWWLKVVICPFAVGEAVVDGIKSGAKKISTKLSGKKK